VVYNIFVRRKIKWLVRLTEQIVVVARPKSVTCPEAETGSRYKPTFERVLVITATSAKSTANVPVEES
jgi:hypothetical protein